MPFEDLLARIRAENLNVYSASPQRFREDVSQEAQIAQDYRGRLIYELLQNADDAMSSGPSSAAGIEFDLDDGALWVANSGRPLDEADVRGLCGISASSKSAPMGKRRASIGHKGMGFKSVLEISDAPEVYSTSTCFCFGPERALSAVAPLVSDKVLVPPARAPVMRFPWHIDEQPARWRELRERGMQTAFRFPLRQGMTQEQRTSLADALRDLPIASLVFLKHLGRIGVSIRGHGAACSFSWTARRQNVTDLEARDVPAFSDAGTYRVVLTPDAGSAETFLVAHDPEITIGDHRGGLDHYTWQGIEVSEVSVAARMRDGRPVALESGWRKLHVFLPTGEPCPYDLLVSGAFSSNLSRQEIRVEADAANYNRLLLQNASRLVREMLIPRLLRDGAPVADVLRLLDRGLPTGAACATATAQALFGELKIALSDFAFLTREEGAPIAISECVVPPSVNAAELGRDFRALLPPDAAFATRHFPSTELCGYDIARILVDHGAHELNPEDAATALARSCPRRSRVEVSGKLFVDPVLRVLEHLWQGLDAERRTRLALAVRREPLFPVGIAADDTAQRISVQNLKCFYPPRSFHGTVPLDGLCFLMQEICWGDLTPPERNQRLKQEVATWQALFELLEFKFPAVMVASVLPVLELGRDAERSVERESLHSLERIAAICQLAGRAPNASAPLPYERLGSNRAIFNLSRLDVPCRGAAPGEFVWVPAYRAYLGSDWVGENSVEGILAVGRNLGITDLPDIHFVAGPNTFAGLLKQYQHIRESTRAEDLDIGTDEVGLDEDEDAALEGDERSRWLTFFQWLGVNQALRPVHFHDVEDRASGWLKTYNLQRPEGWIFQRVTEDVWVRYADRVRQYLTNERIAAADSVPYFYRLHDLEHLVVLLRAAAEDATSAFGRALYEHLARNWPFLERFARAQIAQVPRDSFPGMRSKPPRARDEELFETGADFWVARLQDSPFCPTGHGPRHAAQVWLPTLEVERRFGRRGRTGSYLLPALAADPIVLKGKAKGFAQAVGVREELTPATFTLDDARVLLERLREIYSRPLEDGDDLRQELREVIRPAYRNLFELLSGRSEAAAESPDGAFPLSNVPLLAQDGNGRFRFFDDRQLYYIDRRETRERLQAESTIWSFVIEAQPAARTPMVQLFGVRVLEEALRWAPRPGDKAFNDEECAALRSKLRSLAPYILARLSADRADEKLARSDAQRLRHFVERLEPVAQLELGCELDGHKLNLGNVGRDSFVAFESDNPARVFVVWGNRRGHPSHGRLRP